MANVIKIKRSATHDSTDAPTNLAVGELAYTQGSKELYICRDTDNTGGSEIIHAAAPRHGVNTIVTVGTITTGVWSGTAIAAGKLPALDGITVPANDLSLNSKKITSLAEPSNDTDAATKGYVDAKAQGLDVKASVKLATNAALPNNTYTQGNTTDGIGAYLEGASNGFLHPGSNTNKIDSVAVAVNDRVLVKNETAAKNGIYTVTTLGSGSAKWKLTRATDFDEDDEITSAAFTFVEQGTDNANSGFVVSTDGLIEFSSSTFSGVAWSQFSGAGQITPGDALNATGNRLDVNVKSNSGIVITGDELELDLGASGITGSLEDGNIDSANTWNNKQNALTFGIGNTNAVKIDSTAVADDEYARFTASGLESRSTAEVLSDIGAAASGHDHDSDYAAATHSHGVTTGGTGLSTITTNGVMYGSGTGAVGVTAQGGDKAILYSNSGTPAWTTTPDGLTIDCGTF